MRQGGGQGKGEDKSNRRKTSRQRKVFRWIGQASSPDKAFLTHVASALSLRAARGRKEEGQKVCLKRFDQGGRQGKKGEPPCDTVFTVCKPTTQMGETGPWRGSCAEVDKKPISGRTGQLERNN